MYKKTAALALLLVVCLALCSCARLSAGTDDGIIALEQQRAAPVLLSNLPCDFPLVSEPASISVIISSYNGLPQQDVFVWRKYAEMTGVQVDWIPVTSNERGEVVATALMNKQDIDLIMRCKISTSRLTLYGESGLILNLAKDDMLKNNAPNCWAYLQSHPEALASVTNPDGSIYALPQINSGPELRVSRKMYINKNWLSNLGMEPPKTTEELYLLLKAFKEQDANGNGDPNDEIPLCTQDWASIEEAFYGAFGLGNRGIHNTTVDCDEATGKARFIESSDAYRDFLSYLNRLYADGLMDKHTFTMTKEQWYLNAEKDIIGVFAHTNLASLPADKADNWVAVEDALIGPNGDQMWAAVRANFHSTGAAVIPATCKNPELVLRWLDYFWTDAGTLFYHMGVEGETFITKADGSYDYAPAIYDEMKAQNKPFDDIVARYSPYPGGGNPTVEIAPYFMGGEMAPIPAQAARSLFEYGPKEYWPSFTFTADENETLGNVRSDLDKYCTAMRIEFITGVKPLSEWDEYKAQLSVLNVAELLRVYDAAIERYNALYRSIQK